MKRQITELLYGNGAKEAATEKMHFLFRENDYTGPIQHEIASPFADWTVEQIQGGWAVFVTEPPR